MKDKQEFYIPIRNGEKNQSVQLISTKGMFEVIKLIPLTSQIRHNLNLQRELLAKDPSFKPMPIIIKIGQEHYGRVLKEVQRKYPRYNHNKIPLVSQSNTRPVVVIELSK